MFKYLIKIIFIVKLFCILLSNAALSEIVSEIKVLGNKRVSSEIIKTFTNIKVNDDIDINTIDDALKSLYETVFFKNIKIELNDNILIITVEENPMIQNFNIEGVKAKRINEKIIETITLKQRSSFEEKILENDLEKIKALLKDMGYYFSKIDTYKETLDDNKINLTFKIDIGEKAKIKKISFIGNKVFKDNKLKGLIVSEEYKFWKFISGKKFLNQNLNNLDVRLLKNFYLNKGYYNVEINSSFARMISKNEFELIFNINANEKIFFNDLVLDLPIEFEKKNFSKLEILFSKLKGKPYSINSIENILNEIDEITINEQYESIKASVIENILSNKINLSFKIEDAEKLIIEKINIYGNNITNENVIRNQLILDEGDPFNEILANKSINNIKNLNFFKFVESEIIDGSNNKSKIININLKEKPTGEIAAGAGVGTSGGTVTFGVRENNYLGKGLAVNANVTVNPESLKGILSVKNPNYRNSDKSAFFSLESTETDRLTNSGYKMNKIGLKLGTDFEYLDDLNFGLSTSGFFEKIETNNSASERQKSQKGNYFDSFASINFDYDKRNQKFQTSKGYRSIYDIKFPIISDTNTLTNFYSYKYFTELYDNNVSSISYYFKSVNSISNDDVKLSERAFIPSSRLRGFEGGKVGPKDGDDYVGGNFVSTINIASTLPFLLENNQSTDFMVFFDAANIWGVDYDSSLNNSKKIRSSIGIGVDWFTPVGPLNFSLSQALSKNETDTTESFRFNLGTTF